MRPDVHLKSMIEQTFHNVFSKNYKYHVTKNYSNENVLLYHYIPSSRNFQKLINGIEKYGSFASSPKRLSPRTSPKKTPRSPRPQVIGRSPRPSPKKSPEMELESDMVFY
jgi:hypothetical protein